MKFRAVLTYPPDDPDVILQCSLDKVSLGEGEHLDEGFVVDMESVRTIMHRSFNAVFRKAQMINVVV